MVNMQKVTAGIMLMVVAVLIVLFGTTTEYAPPSSNTHVYAYFQDVHVMVFIGFGFLMSFLHRGGFTATGHAYFVAAIAALWAILVHHFWKHILEEHGHWKKIQISTGTLIVGDFGAAAVLISFGAMLGRISALQLLVLALVEVVFYALNEAILVERFKITDIGGSMVIHAFGAYFGLACSFVLEFKNARRGSKSMADNKPSNMTDTLAMIGTLFLFCFWPSFNGAPANQGLMIQDRTVVNTYMSIFASCIVAFAMTSLLRGDGRFRMVEVQNATIAGGVAIGAAADFTVRPFGALLVGSAAGALSVVGYQLLTPFLERVIGLKDTCGIHNLHGMPAVLGALVSIAAAAAAKLTDYPTGFHWMNETPSKQSGFQALSLIVTLCIALLSGAFTGLILRFVPGLDRFFDDSCEYETAETADEEHEKSHSVSRSMSRRDSASVSKSMEELPSSMEPIHA